jgi:arylsulfatase A-like enzyme
VSLTDVTATAAAVVGVTLPDDAAEDSFDLLPALLGRDAAPVRPFLITQAFAGGRDLSIRRGSWKYLNHAGSGGNNYASSPGLRRFVLPESAPRAPGQLYDLKADPGETKNLYFERPEVVRELKALLDEARSSGRTRPPAARPTT